MKMRSLEIAAAVSVLAAFVGIAPAEDCGKNVPAILVEIEQCDVNENRQELIGLLRCLWAPAVDLVKDYDDFIKEDTFEKIENANYKDRLDIIRVLVPLLKSKDRIIKNEVVAALAYYRYPTTKQLLADYPDSPQKAIFYAILRYGSSYRWAIDQLEKLKRGENQGENISIIDWMAYLNLLYRLAEPGSLSYVNELGQSSLPEEIRARAELVKARILELHPEVK